MVQRLLTDEKSIQKEQDFSTLAWRFNNLNSTAKMLLVGASSQSVPFIPISELASTDAQYTSTNIKNIPSNQAALAEIQRTYQAAPPPPEKRTQIIPVSEVPIAPYSEPFSVIHTEQEKLSIKSISPKTTDVEFETVHHPIHVSEEEKQATLENKVEYDDNKISRWIDSQTNNKPNAVSETFSPSWTYRKDTEDEQFYSLKTNEGTYADKNDTKQPLSPIIKNSAKTVAVVSLLALMGLAGYNALKQYSDKNIDSLTEEKDIPETDEQKIGSSALSDKTFFEEDNKTQDTLKQSSTEGSSSTTEENKNSTTPESYYQPTVRKANGNIRVKKAKVYTLPSSYQPLPRPIASTEAFSVQEPLSVFLYDPSTVYDSSANEAIKPQVMTAERFPLEISYPKPNNQFEANFEVPSYSASQPSASEPSAQLTQDTTDAKELPKLTSSNSTGSTAAPVQNQYVSNSRVQSGYPSNKDDVALTEEEKAILESPDDNDELKTSDLQIPSGGFKRSNPYSAPQAGVSEDTINSPAKTSFNQPLTNSSSASQPINRVQDDLSEGGEAAPILRKPVQSSSSQLPEVLKSPYQQNVVPMTSSSIIAGSDQTSEATEKTETKNDSTSTPHSNMQRNQLRKGRIIRFFGRSQQAGSPYHGNVTNSSSSSSNPQSASKAEGNTIVSLKTRSLPLWKSSENEAISESRLNQLEVEASRVYVHPSPYVKQRGLDGVNLSLL